MPGMELLFFAAPDGVLLRRVLSGSEQSFMPGMELLFFAACVLPSRGINGVPEKSTDFLGKRRNRPNDEAAIRNADRSESARANSDAPGMELLFFAACVLPLGSTQLPVLSLQGEIRGPRNVVRLFGDPVSAPRGQKDCSYLSSPCRAAHPLLSPQNPAK